MNTVSRSVLAAAGLLLATQAAAEITFYEREAYGGRSYTADRSIRNLDRFDFGDRASSIVVARDRWEVCEFPRFEGRCVLLRPGNYPSLRAMGLNNAISSVRNVDREGPEPNARLAPPPVAVYTPPAVAVAPAYPAPAVDYRRRPDERLYEAPVTSVRAVVGPPEQRCWIERERVVDRGPSNVPGAVAGAIIGGILGHQVGSGSGRDVATVGGAVAGAAIGSNVDRDRGGVYAQDVQRCNTVPSARPSYYDVTYTFSGREYRVQLANPPGPTVLVNSNGEPRA
jgi:uncharacterized protein YcfJ